MRVIDDERAGRSAPSTITASRLPRIAERSLGVARKAGSLALTLVRRLASAG